MRLALREVGQRLALRVAVAAAPRGEVEPFAVFETRRQTPGRLPLVPAAAGLVLASAVVYDLIGIRL